MPASPQFRLGSYETTSVAGESVRAFIPPPRPPRPPLEPSTERHDLLEKANRSLGRFDGVATLAPDPALFLHMYVRKEALLSSQIEGTQSSFSDLLLFESEQLPGVPMDDVIEVSRYVSAMGHGLTRVRGGFPLSLRLIKEIHKIMLPSGRGSKKTPGEFRASQNWFGGTRPGNAGFVPPPPHRVIECMGLLENFSHNDPVKTPLLIKAALAHVQFETIHPFPDGNGRVGRLLVTLLFCDEGALAQPMLYLSLYFKKHRGEYYKLLQRVRTKGEWEEWLDLFLLGVIETTDQAVRAAQRSLELFRDDRARIEKLGRPAASVLRLHHALQERAVLSIPRAPKRVGVSQPTITSAMAHLTRLGIVRETTGRKLYVYDAYLKILGEGTEPIR